MPHLPGHDRRVQHPEDGLGEGGLAAAGLPHKAEDLATFDVKAHVREGLKAGLLSEKAPVLIGDAELFNFQYLVKLFHGVSSWGSRR